MSTYIVKNINGTGDNDVPYGCISWLHYWKKNVFCDNQNYCRRVGCNKLATDGAHVQIKDGQNGDEWYIVPLCHEHNMTKDTEFEVSGPLVPVDLDKYSIVK
jgi:hypothetical protein